MIARAGWRPWELEEASITEILDALEAHAWDDALELEANERAAEEARRK